MNNGQFSHFVRYIRHDKFDG